MAYIYMDFDQGVPQLAFTGCSWCTSLMGTSLCQVKNRGCCSYFPKFYPVELQRMAQSSEGMEALDMILNMPGVVFHEDHIQVKGTYDVSLHEKMLKEGKIPTDGTIQDTSVFFRTCPFVRPGVGCTIPARYRSYVCNFFLCREFLEHPDYQEQLAQYIRERANYVRYLEWENNQLLQAIQNEGLSIKTDLDDVLKLLASLPVNQYDYPVLEPVDIQEDVGKGA